MGQKFLMGYPLGFRSHGRGEPEKLAQSYGSVLSVRFTANISGLMVSIAASQAVDPGLIPS